MKTLKGFIIAFSMTFCVLTEKLVCYSKSKAESKEIYKYFHDIHARFYVDISPDYPIWDSSTIFLKSQGWSGLNLLTTNEKLLQFTANRGDQLNIFTQIVAANSSIKTNLQNNGIQTSTMAQICKNFIPKKPSFLTIPTKYVNALLSSNDWNIQICRPKLILIREYQLGQTIDERMEQNFNKIGYESMDTSGQFSVFIEKKQIQNFNNKTQSTKEVISNQLISFTSILQNLMNSLGIEIQKVKGSKLTNQILINFAKYNANIDINHLIQSAKLTQQNFNPKYIVIMQFNPLVNRLILQASFFNIEIVELAESKRFYHITYYSSGSDKSREIHVYIFDHEFVETNQNQIDIVTLLGDQNEKEVQTTEGVTINKGSKSERQRIEQQKLIEKARTQSTIESKRWGKAKETKASKNLKNATLPNIKIEPKIQNLTPENILADEQVINRTILIIVLISSTMGSIILTAVITACIMKKKHKAHVKRRIKHNSDLQIEQFTEQGSHEIKKSANQN